MEHFPRLRAALPVAFVLSLFAQGCASSQDEPAPSPEASVEREADTPGIGLNAGQCGFYYCPARTADRGLGG